MDRKMPIGTVLVEVECDRLQEVYLRLLQIPEIVTLYPLSGEGNIMAILEADDPDRLERIVVEEIRTVEGVLGARSLVGATSQGSLTAVD